MAFLDQPPRRMTVEQYLAWEAQQPEKWELHDGGVVKMKNADPVTGVAGGSLRHFALAGNVYLGSRNALRRAGSACSAYPDGVELRVPNGRMFYPDSLVVCGPQDGRAQEVSDPALVAEVLSPTTEAEDLGPKWTAYQTIPSLQHYLIVQQDQAAVDLFTRSGEIWSFRRVFGDGATVDLPALGVSVSLDELFADLPPLSAEPEPPEA
jgi:Uma2 family endonuclease